MKINIAKHFQNLVWLLLLSPIVILINCSPKDDPSPEEEMVTVSVKVKDFGFIDYSTGGRFDAVNWDHIFGGNGTITFTNTDISESFTFNVSGDQLSTAQFDIPTGMYNITLDLSSTASKLNYLPFTGSTTGLSIESNRTIPLDATTDYGLVGAK